MTIYIAILLLLTLCYSFYTGLNNGAIAIASAVATRAIKPKTAIFYAAIVKLIAPILFFLLADMAVANTIKDDIIVESSLRSISELKGFIFICVGLVSALIWGIATYSSGFPNSVSHTLMGGIVGSAIATMDLYAIQWDNVGIRIILVVILAPIVGMVASFIFMKILGKILSYMTRQTSFFITFMQWLNVMLLASSISINNTQKDLGVMMLVAVCIGSASGFIEGNLLWLLLAISVFSALGLMSSGYRVINTIGNKIYRLCPHHSFVAQLSSAVVVFASSGIGVPVSTGQIVSSSIMGVGAADKLHSVRWGTASRIILSWFITFPAVMLIGYTLAKIVFLFVK